MRHTHTRRVIGVTHAYYRYGGGPATIVLYGCSTCDKHWTERAEGHWTKEQLEA